MRKVKPRETSDYPGKSWSFVCNEYITPVIIKYPFWQMTLVNEKAVYACLNYGEAFCPEEIEDRSICIDGDIGDVLSNVCKMSA
jgi:hypothetical protein